MASVTPSSCQIVTAMNDHVSWGLYIANFTFLVGLAAAPAPEKPQALAWQAELDLWLGDYERALDVEISGVRLRTPILRIHTVAAGGGSICRFDGVRLRVAGDSVSLPLALDARGLAFTRELLAFDRPVHIGRGGQLLQDRITIDGFGRRIAEVNATVQLAYTYDAVGTKA